MEQIFDTNELASKTIKKVIEDDQLIIIFNDETFAIFHTYDTSESIYISDDKMDLIPDRWNYRRLHEMGLISKEEKAQWEDMLKQEKYTSTQAYELNQLALLKAKYPDA